MNASFALEVSAVCKVYRQGLLRRPFTALQEITFAVGRGEIFGLLGPNGAGKTTLVKILLGIARASGGQATLLGRPAGDRQSRIRVGYLPEALRMAGHHTAESALQYYGRLSGLSLRTIRAKQTALLEDVGLADRARERIKKYSKGMLQRLGLAQALLHDPELLVLDEPTDGLDPVGRSHVRSLLHRLRSEGRTVFLNSHLLQEVETVCDRVAILDRGKLRAIGTVAEIAPPQTSGLEVDLQLAGQESDLRAALGERGVRSWKTGGNGEHHLTLRLLDQAAVDECLDDLRRHRVSLVGLARRRVTLEDAFLQLFTETSPDNARRPESAPDRTPSSKLTAVP
jgi:ABC-2 type transport system ATP-binding protein